MHLYMVTPIINVSLATRLNYRIKNIKSPYGMFLCRKWVENHEDVYTSTIVFPQTEKSHFSWFIMTTGYISTCMSHSLSGEN